MSRYIFSKLNILLLLIVVLSSSSSAFANANITILNGDSPNTGFNDPTPAAPVGGNTGTTVGQQRLNAFMFAAGIWGATLNSNQTIVIRANWESQSCSANSGVLGSAGAFERFANFPGAPQPNTWYSVALANALSNSDLNGASEEITARFNSSLGTPGCLENTFWYYGLDNAHGNGIDLVSVLLHEFGHGLGFQSFAAVNGSFPSNFPGIYDRFLRDNSTGKLWVDMTAGERQASAINTGNLVWAGPQTVADVPNVLGTPRLRINSPPGIAGNYAVGTAEFGAKLTSPGITDSVVRATDPSDGAGTSTTDGCSPLTNAGVISGNIAFIDRGTCNFTVKVKNAQDAGAVAVIIGNVSTSANPETPPDMSGGEPSIIIPVVGIRLTDANAIRAQLGGAVNGTVFLDTSVRQGADGSNRPLIYAPNPREAGSSVSHFDESLFPNQLMEPNNSGDLTHSVRTPADLTFSLFRDLGWTGTGVTPTTIQFSAASSNAAESVGSHSITVTRTGGTTGISTVDFTTSDTSGNNTCNIVNGAANSRCDYLKTLGKLTFAAGETSKTISIPIINDVFVEAGGETFTVSLSNATGATLGTSTHTVTINDNDTVGAANPIDNSNFFVRQHYIDFLNREPDSAGLAFWVNEIESCGANASCREVKRINVSAAFFLSIEFQETGYLVYRFYKAAFSNLTSPPGAPVPIVFNDFLRDTQEIRKGVEVGVGNWQAQLEANKQAYALAFVQRADFLSQYPNSMSASDFVTQLNIRSGGALSPGEQTTQINILGATPSDVTKRAQVLRNVAEDQTLKDAEFNKAFVLMQYFGYMRRSPNDFPDTNFDGFNFWLQKLNDNGGNFIQAEMVKAFITSIEYRNRFAP